MEAALDADIILTPKKAAQKYKQVEYVTLKVHANPNQVFLSNAEYSKTTGSTEVSGNEKIPEVA